MNDVIKLIKEIEGKSPEGFNRKERTSREIFAEVLSTGAAEFFRAGKMGLKPEYKISVYAPEYEGEQLIEYDGKVYEIYRTYQNSADKIELYVKKRLGKNE